MIRTLYEPDRAEVHRLLQEAPQQNLYMLGNLLTLGFGEKYCQFWGDFAEKDSMQTTLRAVLNRYMNGWALYGHSSADWQHLAYIVDTYSVAEVRLQDNPGGIPTLVPYLQHYVAAKASEEELMTLKRRDFHPVPPPPGYSIRRADLSDLSRLCEFYSAAAQMTRTPAAVERPLRDTRIWIAELGDQLVSAALTNAETEQAAMIGGVFTALQHRGHGLSQALCSALCRELLELGKEPVLYWDAPAAGAVYRKLGFGRTGKWRSVWLTRKT